jgi:hypothetical protein
MIHIDTKQLACFQRVWAIESLETADKADLGVRGYEKVHVAIYNATRLATVEVLPEEQQSTTVGFLVCAVGWFSIRA